MRLLHTSDWHLGRSFHRVALLDAQAAFVDHLVEVVRTQGVDAVLVSGDVYDRALPPVEAVSLASDALRRLVGAGAQVVVTSGNHDSAPRLGFASRLLELAGLHIRADVDRVAEPVLLSDDHGPVACYGIPYLEPDLLVARWSLGSRSHQSALTEAMRRIRADLASRPAGTRAVVLSHAFVAGGARSDSERDISVGGVDSVAPFVFDGIDYVALGHLHGRHTLTPSLRYSGSPLAYSFSEAGQVKGSWLVDLAGPGSGAVPSAVFVEAPVPRRVSRISGRLDQLMQDPSLAQYEHDWLQITLTDDVRPRGAMARLRERFPHLLVLAVDAARTRPLPAAAATPARSDDELVERFFLDIAGRPVEPGEAALLRRGLDAVRLAQDLAS
jgi:exonuclease SbcD